LTAPKRTLSWMGAKRPFWGEAPASSEREAIALKSCPMSTQHEIARRVVESILAQQLAPGQRLGEQELADLFQVSRTTVREALMQLQARGFVEVRPRRGWYVVEPSVEDARDAFAARRVVEAGILTPPTDPPEEGRPLQQVARALRRHIEEEEQAINGADAATRAFLLADFHVCLAESLGHRLLCGVLRDLTARTTLAATLYQSTHEAKQSCAEHAAIVQALEAGDLVLARQRMLDHIGHVEHALSAEVPAREDRLRQALSPITAARKPAT
jgi:DNA-binding GntR family transcriptional regulator